MDKVFQHSMNGSSGALQFMKGCHAIPQYCESRGISQTVDLGNEGENENEERRVA